MRTNQMGTTHRAVAAMPTRAAMAPTVARVSAAFSRSAAPGEQFSRADAKPDDDDDKKDPDESTPGEDGNTDDDKDDDRREDDDKENKPVQTQKSRYSSLW